MLKRVVPKRAVLRRARAGPGRAARLATYNSCHVEPSVFPWDMMQERKYQQLMSSRYETGDHQQNEYHLPHVPSIIASFEPKIERSNPVT